LEQTLRTSASTRLPQARTMMERGCDEAAD
jgi:hypothetical protein